MPQEPLLTPRQQRLEDALRDKRLPLTETQRDAIWDATHQQEDTDPDQMRQTLAATGVPRAAYAAGTPLAIVFGLDRPGPPGAVGRGLDWAVTQGADLVVGGVKGAADAARTFGGMVQKLPEELGGLVHKIPGVSQAVDAVYGQPGLSRAAFSGESPGLVSQAVDAVYGQPGLSQAAFSEESPLRQDLQPSNTGEKIGYGLEKAAEFFTPGGAGFSAAKLAPRLPQSANITARLMQSLFGASIEGAGAAGVTVAQGGSLQDAASTGLTAGAITAAAGPVLRAAGQLPQWLGERIERSLLKPTTFTSEGLTPTQIVKKVYQYGVGGNLQTSLEKITQKIDTLRGQLAGVLTHSSQQGAGVSLNQVARDTLEEFTGNRDAQAAIERISREIEFHLNSQGKPILSGVMDLLDANTAKQAVGDVGSWTHGFSGQVISDADRWLEKVANKYYSNLKTAIENMAQGPAKSINNALGDLIMLRGVLMRRIPVAERANVLNMGDLLSVSSHTFGLSIANRLLQSGTVANALESGGGAIVRSAPIVSSLAGRLAGALSQPGPVPPEAGN